MKKQNGFTLVELMVAMVIMAAVLAGVYMTYFSQQKSYMNQEQVAVMQQNLRAAMTIMERDLRLAGYHNRNNWPAPPAAKPGFLTANNDSFSIEMDIDENGAIAGPDEIITYSWANGTIFRERNDGAGALPLVNNIDALDIVYGSGVSAVMNGGGTDVPLAGPTNVSQIVSVQITILARSTQIDQQYVNRIAYQNQQGVVLLAAPNDNIRRRLLTIRTQCRNLWYRI